MRRLSLPPRFRRALGFVLLAACVSDDEAACTVDGPLGPGWNTPTPTVPDFVVLGAWQGAVGLGDTIRWALFGPTTTSVWSTDSSIAAVRFQNGEILVIGRGIGTATIRAQYGQLESAAPVEVVAEICTANSAIPSLTFDQEAIVSLNDEDCALPRRMVAPAWPWSDQGGQPPSLRAEGRRFTLTDSTFVRVDAAAAGLRPYLQITSDTLPVAAKFHFIDSLFLAVELGPGEYVLWTATEAARPTTDLRLALREVTLCPTIAEAPMPIAPGDTVSGALGRTSCHTSSGHTAADFRMTVPTTDRYYVAVRVLEPAAYGEVFFLVRGKEYGDGYLASGNSLEWAAGAHEFRLMSTSDISYRVLVLACPSAGPCP